jgi:hypothetical protein
MLQLRGSIKRHRMLTAVAAAGLAAGTSLAAVAASPVAAAAAPTLPVTSYSISTSNVTVHSSTHKKLTYFFFITNNTKNGNLDLGLSSGQTESHDWNFALTKAAFHVNPDKASGRITTNHQLKGFGKFTIKVSSASKARKTCASSSGFTTTRNVRITGTPMFNTKSGNHGWGKVDVHKVTLKGVLSVDHGTPSGNARASSDLSAFAPKGRSTQLSAFRQVTIRSPKHASRFDSLTGKGGPIRARKAAGGKLSFLIKGTSRNATGTATVTTTSKPFASTCRKVTTNGYFSSRWTNGPKRLTLHAQIEGNLVVGNNTNASVEVSTKK